MLGDAAMTPSDRDGWLRLEPGSNRIVHEETGVLGVQHEIVSLDRWG